MDDATAIIGLMNVPRIGSVRLNGILGELERQQMMPRYLLEYDAASLVEQELLTETQATFFTSDEQREWRQGITALLEAESIQLIPATSGSYPGHLRTHGGAMTPPILMAVGNTDLLQQPGIAFAGARRATEQGVGIARTLVEQAVEHRFTVVSGGAQGTDVATHEEALLRGGNTIVVLAEGILSPRARQLTPLLDGNMAAIVSSFLPHDGWQAWRAMERNRTILGLCDRLVVIEAGHRGGTLAAGREALQAGIDTWVLDHADPPEAASGNRVLLELGARPIPVSGEGRVTTPDELFAMGGWMVTEIRP